MNVLRRLQPRGISTPVRSVYRGVRMIHNVPELLHLDREAGIPGLLSPGGLELAWFEYQSHLVNELNALTQETSYENLSPFEIASNLTSPYKAEKSDEEKKLLFVASQAYANEFFFRGLKESVNAQHAKIGEPTEEELRYVEIRQLKASDKDASEGSQYSNINSYLQNSTLESLITSSFDSPEAFRELFITRADAMFGAGYTWLVLDNSDKLLKVVNTYNAGIPLMKHQGASGNSEAIMPLLNFNLWQHVYIKDYGFVGRRQYLSNAFDSINWSVVQQRLPVNAF